MHTFSDDMDADELAVDPTMNVLDHWPTSLDPLDFNLDQDFNFDMTLDIDAPLMPSQALDSVNATLVGDHASFHTNDPPDHAADSEFVTMAMLDRVSFLAVHGTAGNSLPGLDLAIGSRKLHCLLQLIENL
jgi:hypothetical protein